MKRWFALLPDFVLYSFKSDESSEALTATPIPGLTVMGGTDWKGDTVVSDKEKALKLCYSNVTPSNNNSHIPMAARKTYYLMANTKEDIERYIFDTFQHRCNCTYLHLSNALTNSLICLNLSVLISYT